MRLPACAAILFCLLTQVSWGTEPKRTATCAVRVERDGEDSVGSRLALAVKERIRSSTLYRLSETDAEASFRIRITTVDLKEVSNHPDTVSAVAVVFTSDLH